MQKEIKHTLRFSQKPQEVWEYLTNPALLEQWLMKSTFLPIVGHKFHFIGNCDETSKAIAQCEVLEVTPFSQLVYSWQTNSAKDNKPFTSKVVWTIVAKDNGTELQLVHNGFRALEDVVLHNDGWTRIMNKIGTFLTVIAI